MEAERAELQAKYDQAAKQSAEAQLQLAGLAQERAKLLEQYTEAQKLVEEECKAGTELKSKLKETEDSRDSLRLEIVKFQGEAQLATGKLENAQKECEATRTNIGRLEAIFLNKEKREAELRSTIDMRTLELEDAKKSAAALQGELEKAKKDSELQTAAAKSENEAVTLAREQMQKQLAELEAKLTEERAGRLAAEDSMQKAKNENKELVQRAEGLAQQLRAAEIARTANEYQRRANWGVERR